MLQLFDQVKKAQLTVKKNVGLSNTWDDADSIGYFRLSPAQAL